MSDKPRSSAPMSVEYAAAGMPVAPKGYIGYTYDSPAFRSSVFETLVACGMLSNDLDQVRLANSDRPWENFLSKVACSELKLALPTMAASTMSEYFAAQPVLVVHGPTVGAVL